MNPILCQISVYPPLEMEHEHKSQGDRLKANYLTTDKIKGTSIEYIIDDSYYCDEYIDPMEGILIN